ncbi:MAG TPA: DUF4349 domain-containing protein [Vicinamibacterales bacterium]|nr:DUF4349 domain-containing protein [Vicinamibacterales bacterium]
MAFLDGEAPVPERAAIEAHVVACAECRQVISDFGAVNRTMAAWQPENAPATLRLPPVVRGHASVFPRIPRLFSWRPAYFVLAAGAIAATMVLVVGTRYSTDIPTAATAAKARAEGSAVDQISVTNGAVDGRLDRNGPVDGFGALARDLPAGGGGGRPEPAKGIAEAQSRVAGQAARVAPETVAARQPSVIRTATLRLVPSDFNAARASVESIVAQAGGFLDQITVNGAPGSARTLTGSLRVPSARLNEALTRLRQLGQVTEDTQGSEDVTDQIVDLDARLANARATEQRLNEILKSRTGKLSDVLQVEREISRVRLEIEQMDAQRVNTSRRVTYATITLQIDEIRKAGLESGPLSFSTRLRVATADGLEAAVESVVRALLFVLRAGPATLTWLAAGLSIWILARRIRRRVGRQTS